MLTRGSEIASLITALLGPTNTGKTHRATLRMLEHETGIIGLPLRLLAREVYDRVAAQVGEHEMTLVTGEEKRVPHRPRYWVCTVEGMPSDMELDFLAVDEIQLIAHPERGHTFTQRLLHARGRKETWFMGAETVRPLLQSLVPTAKIQQHPRLSTLTYKESLSLSALPPRTAVVAFSAAQVYELAERLRQRFGGAAVVLGALSPRTRNAQVALYQSGEVDHLVATDAIGMGLNLDIAHIAFASVRKFDGQQSRDLTAAELGQIAGRAGRYLNNGTFSTLAPVPDLPFPLARAIEQHQFNAEHKAIWRNHDLDFSSTDTLVATLKQRPKFGALRLVEYATDLNALLRLREATEIQRLARGHERVQLLWEVCQIPDYRNLLVDGHADLLGELFLQLVQHGRLATPWLEERIARIDNTEGDLDALLARIGFIRTWTYVANHSRWVAEPARLQARTGEIEDRLSDAVHERLVARFVERGGKRHRQSRKQSQRPSTTAPQFPASHIESTHPFHALTALRDRLIAQPVTPPPLTRDGATRELLPLLDVTGSITSYGQRLARLGPGQGLSRPRIVFDLNHGGRPARDLERTLQVFIHDTVTHLTGSLTDVETQLSAAGRGLVYQLRQSLGIVLTQAARQQVAALTDTDVKLLHARGVVLGKHVTFSRRGVKSGHFQARLAVVQAHCGRLPEALQVLNAPVSVDLSRVLHIPQVRQICLWLGYATVSHRALRADVLERVEAELSGQELGLAELTRTSQMFGCSRVEAARLLLALGHEGVKPLLPQAQRKPRRRHLTADKATTPPHKAPENRS